MAFTLRLEIQFDIGMHLNINMYKTFGKHDMQLFWVGNRQETAVQKRHSRVQISLILCVNTDLYNFTCLFNCYVPLNLNRIQCPIQSAREIYPLHDLTLS